VHWSCRTLNEEGMHTGIKRCYYELILRPLLCRKQFLFLLSTQEYFGNDLQVQWNHRNTNPDSGVHWLCQTINKEGMYTGAKNAIMSVDFMPIARYNFFSIAIMYQGILWTWSTSTVETYKTLTQTVVCTDHVEH